MVANLIPLVLPTQIETITHSSRERIYMSDNFERKPPSKAIQPVQEADGTLPSQKFTWWNSLKTKTKVIAVAVIIIGGPYLVDATWSNWDYECTSPSYSSGLRGNAPDPKNYPNTEGRLISKPVVKNCKFFSRNSLRSIIEWVRK